MSKFSKDPQLTFSKRPCTVGTSDDKDCRVTPILPMKLGEVALEIELNPFSETWNKFKLHLLEGRFSTNIASEVKSLILLELESHVLESNLENNLGLSVDELRNIDSFLVRFEDHCIQRILLKFERFKSLSLQNKVAENTILRPEISAEEDHINYKLNMDQVEDRSAHCLSEAKDINDHVSEQILTCALLVFEKNESSTEEKCSPVFETPKKSHSELQLKTSAEVRNVSSIARKQKRCGNGIKSGKNTTCVNIYSMNSCNVSETLRKKSLLQPIDKSEIKCGDTSLTEKDFSSSHDYSSTSEMMLSQRKITHTYTDNDTSKTRDTEVVYPVCGFECESTSLLKEHMKSNTDICETGYPVCKTVFKQRNNLESHLETSLCGTQNNPNNRKSSASRVNSKQGRKSKHSIDTQLKNSSSTSKLPLSGRLCSQIFSGFSKSKSHLNSHIKFKLLKCDICRRTFPGLAKLKRHKLSHTGEKPYNCNVCGTAFADKSHLNVHLRGHSGEKPFKCDICEASFSESTKLKTHKRVHTGEKPFVCEVCGSSFSVSSSLKSHMKIHSGERPYKCHVCDFASAQSSNLKAHLLVHTGEKKFTCDKCGASFTETAKLKRHKMVHTGERPYSCEICGARFADKSHLTVHLRIHSGEKPFKCTFCSSAFMESSKLKNHIRTHTGEKPYVCEICGVSFAVSYSLKSHMRRHTGEKPYKCNICGYATSQSSNLRAHGVVHNGARPRVCEMCGASFSELSKLNRHRIIHQERKEGSSVNLASQQNSGELGIVHLEHLQPNFSQKHTTNYWQEVDGSDLNSTFNSVSHDSGYIQQVTDNSHVNSCPNYSETVHRSMAQPIRTFLTTTANTIGEVYSSVTLPGTVKMLQEPSNRIYNSQTFNFSSVYKGENISDSTLLKDLDML